MLPRHIRHEGLRQIEQKLSRHKKPSAELPIHAIGREHAKKVIEIEKARALPDANVPKIVSFPAT